VRINVNLASTPYENARRFFVQWGAALLIMLAVSGLLVYAAARSWRANHALSRSIAEEQARLEKLDQQEKADLALLNEPQNLDVRERSDAINALIVRKSFSWTRIFNDLEKMMPARLHVVSIAPQLSKNDQLQIRMKVAGESRERAIELVQNMEKAPDFRDAQIISEIANDRKDQEGQGPGSPADAVTFDIVAQYLPSNAPEKEPAQKNASVGKVQAKDAAGGKAPAKRLEQTVAGPVAVVKGARP
jgi:hypothetical protein